MHGANHQINVPRPAFNSCKTAMEVDADKPERLRWAFFNVRWCGMVD